MRKPNIKDSTLLFMFIGTLVYLALRICFVDITNDEAYSFYIMKNFWYAEALCTGNTHWINSLAIKCAILLNLESIGQIRWFSFLSALIFFVLAFACTRSVKGIHLKLLTFALLICNPYIFDYLGLARGYGPGLMFQGLAIFLFLQIKSKRFTFLSLIAAAIGVFCNFSFFYFFMAFSLVYFNKIYLKEGFNSLKSFSFYRDFLIVLGTSSITFRALDFMTNCSNDVIGAGTNNFLNYFYVFTNGLIYQTFELNSSVHTFFSCLIFVTITASGLIGVFTQKGQENPIYFYCSLLLLIMLSTTLLAHFCFGQVLPYYRSALFLFPTTSICFIYLLDTLISKVSLKKIVFLVLSGLFCFHFVWSLSLHSTFDYRKQGNNKTCFDHLKALHSKHVGICPELYGVFRNYYQATKKFTYPFSGELIETRHPQGLCSEKNKLKEYDYLVLFPPYDLSYYKNNSLKFEAVKLFAETGVLIVKINGKGTKPN